jgi:hypothetical protein
VKSGEDSKLQVWQRSFYDIIIRDDQALDLMRLYIQSNPIMWTVDHENPEFEPTEKLISDEYITKGIFSKEDLAIIKNYLDYRRWRIDERNRDRRASFRSPLHGENK